MKTPKAPLKKVEKKNLLSPYWLRIIPYVALILLSFLPLLPFFHSGLPITHDGKDHVARIANFYQNLQDGVLIPRWAENLNWGYGHPILMFLYPFPSYFASLFHFFNFSFIDSVKAVFIISYILSGITMYLWASKMFSRNAGFIAALLYLFAPYRFVDLHVRGAFGEHVAFIFPPLVLFCLYKLSEKRDVLWVSLGSLSLAGLLLSHNAISMMFLPIFFLYGLYLLSKQQQKIQFVLFTSVFVILGFALAAFFVIPAFIEGKYTLRNIVTSKEYVARFVPFMDFIYREWSFGGTHSLSKQIGFVHWSMVLSVIGLCMWWYRRKNSYWQLALGCLIIFVVSLFIMTSFSQFIWDRVTVLQNFQFPWRFLSVSVFITAVCGALVMIAIPKKIQHVTVGTLAFLTVFSTISYWGVNGYLSHSDSFFSSIYEGTTDTGESAPIWSVRFMEKKPKAHMEVIEGKAIIREEDRKTTSHVYTIEAFEKTRIRENTLYFPGWEIKVDGIEVEPEFQDPKHRGLMTFFVEKGIHTVAITFTETKIRLLSNIISIVGLVILGLLCIIKFRFVWIHSR